MTDTFRPRSSTTTDANGSTVWYYYDNTTTAEPAQWHQETAEYTITPFPASAGGGEFSPIQWYSVPPYERGKCHYCKKDFNVHEGQKLSSNGEVIRLICPVCMQKVFDVIIESVLEEVEEQSELNQMFKVE